MTFSYSKLKKIAFLLLALPTLVFALGFLRLWVALPVAALLIFRVSGKEQIRANSILTMAYALCVQLLMLLGRGGVALLLGYDPSICIRFITMDLLSCLFTVVVIWIARRVEGLFEDQKHYLLRIDRERQEEGREQF